MSEFNAAEYISNLKKTWRVVSPEVFKVLEDKINAGWKPIPHYSWYIASPDGKIFNIVTMTDVVMYERPTKKGTYINARVVGDTLEDRSDTGVHRLVALAHLPYDPEWRKKEVNHDDGDKHNNHYTNLEWFTRSQNIKHALRTGLRKTARKTTVLDTTDGVVTVYYGVMDFAKSVGAPYARVMAHYMQRRDQLFLDRYIIQNIDEYMVMNNPKQWKDIVIMDYRVNKIYIVPNATVAGIKTSINLNTVLLAIRQKSMRLVNGCSFMYHEDMLTKRYTFDRFTDLEVSESVKKYSDKPLRIPNLSGVVIFNHGNGIETTFESIAIGAVSTGINVGTLRYILSIGNLWPLEGYSYKRVGNSNAFPTLTSDELAVNLVQKKSEMSGYKVTNVKDNTTCICGSLSEAVSKIGIPSHRVIQYLSKNPEVDRATFRYKDIFQFDEVPGRRDQYLGKF